MLGRAMLLNDMEESTRARVEPKEFNSQTMSMLLKFLYTGAIEQVPITPGRTSVSKKRFEISVIIVGAAGQEC